MQTAYCTHHTAVQCSADCLVHIHNTAHTKYLTVRHIVYTARNTVVHLLNSVHCSAPTKQCTLCSSSMSCWQNILPFVKAVSRLQTRGEENIVFNNPPEQPSLWRKEFGLLYTVHCTLYTVHCTLHCTLYTVHCTLYTIHYTIYNTHFTLLHCTMYTVHYTLYTIYYKLYT